MRRNLLAVVVLGTIMSLVLAACGGGDEPTPTTAPATVAPTSGATAAPTATRAPTTAASPTLPAPTATARPTVAPTATPAPVSSGELVVAMATLGTFGLNPAIRGEGSALGLYDFLMGTKADGPIEPESGLILSWSISADSLTWTFKVRDNLRFHNGDIAISDDFKYAVERGIAPDSAHAQGGDLRKTVKTLEVPDRTTLVVTLTGPSFVWHLDFISRNRVASAMPNVVISKKYITTAGDEAASRTPVGTGAYKFKGVTPGDRVILEAVDYKHFYFGTPRTKTLTITQIPEENTRIGLFQTKAADMGSISTSSINKLKQAGVGVSLRENSHEGLIYWAQYPDVIQGFGPNPFANKKVRQALAWYAIDRKALVDSFLHGQGTPSMDYPVGKSDLFSFVPQAVPKYDPAKAKAMLAEEGFGKGFEIDFYNWVPNALPEAQDLMEAIAVWWEQVGLKVNRIVGQSTPMIQKMLAVYQKDGFSKPTTGGLIWTGAYRETHASFAVLQHNKEALFHVNRDAEGLRLATAYANARNPDEYKRTSQAYQKYAYEEANTFIMLFEAHEAWARSNRVAKDWKLGKDVTYRIEYAAAWPL